MQIARRLKWCEFEAMHFDVSAVLRCGGDASHETLEDALIFQKSAPSLVHQNLIVEGAVPGYHAAYLEHRLQPERPTEEQQSHEGENGEDMRIPLLRPSQG